MASPDIGHGCILRRSDNNTSGGLFVDIGVIHEITPPSLSRETVDVTSHSSPGRWREFVTGLKEAGEMTLDVEFDPANANIAAWFRDIDDDITQWYELIFNDDPNQASATNWIVEGIVTEITPATPIDDKRMLSVTIKVTGQPAFVALA